MGLRFILGFIRFKRRTPMFNEDSLSIRFFFFNEYGRENKTQNNVRDKNIS